MFAHLPARGVGEPVTKEFLRAELSAVRVDLERNLRSMQARMVGTGISLGGLILGTAAFVR